MPHNIPDANASSEALDRFWDDLVLGQPLASEGVDALDAVALGRLHEAAPPPLDPAFRRRLRRDLLRPGGAGRLDIAGSVPASAAPAAAPHSSRWSAAAAAGLLLLATAAALALLRPAGEPPRIIVPAVDAPTPAAFATPGAPATPAAGPGGTPLWRHTDARAAARSAGPGVALAPDGDIWITDGVKSGFQIISPQGRLRGRWGTPGAAAGELALATADGAVSGAVAFRPDGGFYVADSANHRVQQFGPDRAFIRLWGSEGRGDGQFLEPIDIHLDAQGNVFVTDRQRNDVQIFSPDGDYLRTFGGPGAAPGQFTDIGWGALDAAGNLWLADAGGNRIQQFSADGVFLQAIGGSGDTFHAPQGVTVDAAGRIIVADTRARRIIVLSPAGDLLAAFGDAVLDAPVALTTADNGVLYVLDDGPHVALQAFTLALPEVALPE